MTEPTEDLSELYLRYSRRAMVMLLIMVAVLGGMGMAMTLWPDGALARGVEKAPWFFPIATILCVGVLQTSLRKNRWNPNSAEAKAILQDEWRQTNLARAMKIALITILTTQLPMGWLIGASSSELSVLRASLAMGVATITLGMISFLATFLYLDKDQA